MSIPIVCPKCGHDISPARLTLDTGTSMRVEYCIVCEHVRRVGDAGFQYLFDNPNPTRKGGKKHVKGKRNVSA